MKNAVAFRLSGYIKKSARSIAAVCVFATASSLADTLLPYLIGRSIDNIIGKGNVNFAVLSILVLLMALSLLLSVVSMRIMVFLAARTSQKIVNNIRTDVFLRLSRLPLSRLDKMQTGDLTSLFINDSEAVTEGMTQAVTELFAGIITVASSLCFMLAISVKITVAVICVTAVTFAVGYTVTKICNKYFTRSQNLTGEISGVCEEMLTGAETVRLYNYSDKAEKSFDAVNKRLEHNAFRGQFASSFVNPTTRFVGHLSYIAVGVIGGIFGGLGAGGIAAFLTLSTRFSKPFTQLAAVATQITNAYAALGRIFALYDIDEQSDDSDLPDLTVSSGGVEFENIDFAYDPARPLIKNFSASIKGGQRVAIVGPTGAGKTTLVNLLMRFYDINSGDIKIDGQSIYTVKRDALRRNFGMVLQDTWLFTGTVRENLKLSKPDASDEEVYAAAKTAHCHNFIMRLPKGYDTVISLENSGLSAGQIQLLTIARAIVENAPMLILDEATSSVDTLTERRIQQAFKTITKGKTSFIIAHRLSTVRDADLILVMKDGAIAEKGTHEQLLCAHGLYEKLYNSASL